MSKDNHEVLEYATEGPYIVETEDGSYTVVHNEDLIVPAPGQEALQEEIDLVKLVRNAIDNAEKYQLCREEEKGKRIHPVFALMSFFAGAWIVAIIWILYNNGYIIIGG